MKLQFRFTTILFALIVLAGCSTPRKTHLLKDIDQCNFRGRFKDVVTDVERTSFAIVVVHTDSGETVCEEYIRPAQPTPPASSIKTLVAMAVLRKVDANELSLSTKVPMHQNNAAQECIFSNCAAYGPGTSLTVKELLHDMLVPSNNLATNQLIDLVSKPTLAETADALGASGIRVIHKLYDEVNPEPELILKNHATAASLAQLYVELATNRRHFLKDESRELLLTFLSSHKERDRLDAEFPKDLKFFHKPGDNSFSSSDAGFYIAGRRTAVVLVGLQGFNEPDGFKTLRRIGKRAIELTGY